MQSIILILSLASVIALSNAIPKPLNCDFSLDSVTAIYNRAKDFRMNGALDPEDSTKKLIKFWRFNGDDENIMHIQTDDGFIAETFTVEKNGIIKTRNGLIEMAKEIIDYELMGTDLRFKEMNDQFSFVVPLKTLVDETLSDIKLDEKYMMILRKVIAMRRKLYAIREKFMRDYTDLMLYDLKSSTTTSEYHMQFELDEFKGLTETSDGMKMTGTYKCGLETQKYEVMADGALRLVDAPINLMKLLEP